MRPIPIFVGIIRLITILLPIMGAFVWINLEGSVDYAFERICREIVPSTVGWPVRSLGALIGASHLGVLSWALVNLARFLNQGEKGKHLSDNAVRAFRHFALLFLIYVLTTPIVNAVASKMMTGGIAVIVNTDDLKMLGCAIILLIIGHVLGIGQKATEENESFL